MKPFRKFLKICTWGKMVAHYTVAMYKIIIYPIYAEAEEARKSWGGWGYTPGKF